VKKPSAEWYGPQISLTPAAWQHSSVSRFCSIALARTAASGLIGLSSGVRTVTAVRSRPIPSSCLPSLANFSGFRSKIGSSTPS